MDDGKARLNRFMQAMDSGDWKTILELGKSDLKVLAVLAWAEAECNSLTCLSLDEQFLLAFRKAWAMQASEIPQPEIQKGQRLVKRLEKGSVPPTTAGLLGRKVKEYVQHLRKAFKSIPGFRGRPPGDARDRRQRMELAARVLELAKRKHLRMQEAVKQVAENANLHERTVYRYVAEYRQASAQESSFTSAPTAPNAALGVRSNADLQLGTAPERPVGIPDIAEDNLFFPDSEGGR
jgi:hypothetical protein